MRYLSKSDFTSTRDCITKLYFRKQGYPSSSDNPFMDSLARIGHIVGFLAKVKFAEGSELSMDDGVESAVLATKKWIEENESGVLFEATFAHMGRVARVDVLKKLGNRLEVIEVKSSGFDPTLAGRDALVQEKSLNSKLIDLAFQTTIVERAMSDFEIQPSLCLLNESITNNIDGLYGRFEVVELDSNASFKNVEVKYHGDINELRNQDLLIVWPCKDSVEALKSTIWEESQTMVAVMDSIDDFERFRSPRKMGCSNCEYRKMDEEPNRNGFAQCWGDDAYSEPHIFSIRRDAGLAKALNPLVAEGLARMDKVPYEILIGDSGPRVFGIPILQKNGVKEHLAGEVSQIINQLSYPLFFVDFEAIQAPIPYHVGMKPFRSMVLFQWSCHKISHLGDEVQHFEYLNTEPSLPNDRFIRELKNVVGNEGTFLSWSSYENTQLRNYLTNLGTDSTVDSDLVNWLKSILKEKDGGYRQLDLHDDLVKKYYYHHKMGSKTSIKYVLPAILSEGQPVENILLLKNAGLYKEAANGGLVDPYKLLPGVRGGTEAMQAYDEMIYGRGTSDLNFRNLKSRELLAYCGLDTLSMVLIFNYLKAKAV